MHTKTSKPDQMKKGILDRAYCGVLPSHHAYTARGHGYCMVNSLAAAVRYARKVGFQKALILDWDHHHGDGTQEIFTDDPDVYQISVHSGFDLYMASQKVLEAGLEPAGRKAGHRNIPILEEMLSDDFYYGELGYSGRIYRSHNALYAFGDALEELPWCPDIIFIFDGHDAHRDDCGAEVSRWDDDDFRTLSRLALKAARTHFLSRGLHAGRRICAGHKYQIGNPASRRTQQMTSLPQSLLVQFTNPRMEH
jgi:acetoin utilization deacetylase AcuC-like enzyme